MRGCVRLCHHASVRVPEQQQALLAQVRAQLIDVGDVVVDLVGPGIGRPIGTARAARVEHDQGELLPQAGEVGEIGRGEARPARVADEHRAGSHLSIRELAAVLGVELHRVPPPGPCGPTSPRGGEVNLDFIRDEAPAASARHR